MRRWGIRETINNISLTVKKEKDKSKCGVGDLTTITTHHKVPLPSLNLTYCNVVCGCHLWPWSGGRRSP
jgi:hypothetical protein